MGRMERDYQYTALMSNRLWTWRELNSRPTVVILFFYKLSRCIFSGPRRHILCCWGFTSTASTSSSCPIYLKPDCPLRTSALSGASRYCLGSEGECRTRFSIYFVCHVQELEASLLASPDLRQLSKPVRPLLFSFELRVDVFRGRTSWDAF